MKDSRLDTKSERMLELLAQGSPSRVIARQMGYQEGTMRVYLHKLYKRIGVANKTEAVIWYLGRAKAAQPRVAAESNAPIRAPGNNDLFAEMALQEDLYLALGVMSEFLGPYGRPWEIATRLGGEELDAAAHQRRDTARQLWRALLRGDGAYGKRLYDADEGAGMAAEAPSEAILLTGLLVIGGFSSAAENLLNRLSQKRKGGPGVSAREIALVRSLRDAVESADAAAFGALYKSATESGSSAAQRQTAMVMLYQAYRLRKDVLRARQAANAIWAEAEAARRELEAMGDRPLAPATLVPLPEKAGARQAAAREREKVAATR
jgi:DNA-binding CsgD family transcriptional regulator